MSAQQYSKQELKQMTQGKKHMYSQMIRNDYYMPREKCPCVTNAWMAGIVQGKHWVPKCHEVRVARIA
jgi:hypothetical protein